MSFVVNPPTTVNSTAEFDVYPSADLINCIMIEILNDTTFALNLVLPGSKQSYMAPQTAKFFAGTDWYGDTIKMFPLQVMSGNFTGIPQKITVIGYRQGEQVPPDGTVIDLSKTVFVGNTVTVSGTMNELQNDGNAAGAPILETTVQGQTTSNQTATNDGVWNLGVIIANSIVKFFQSSTVDPIVKIGALNHIAEILGGLTVDQNLTVKGSTSLDNGSVTTNGSGSITAISETLNGAGTALTVNNNATISGTATIGTNSVTNNESIGGTLTVTGDATFNGASTGLAVTNNATVGGTLGVTGVSTFTGDATFNGAGNGVSVTNNAQISGNEAVGGTLTVTGDATFNGLGTGVSVAHNTSVGGTLGVTGSSSLDNGALTTDGSGHVTAANIKFSGATGGAASQPKISSDTAGDLNIDAPDGTRQLQANSTGLIAYNDANFQGNVILANGKTLNIKDTGGTSRIILELNGSNDLVIQSADSRMVLQDSAGTSMFILNTAASAGLPANHTTTQNAHGTSSMYLLNPNTSVFQLLTQILGTDSDAHIYANSTNKNLKFTKSDQTGDFVVMNDTTGSTFGMAANFTGGLQRSGHNVPVFSVFSGNMGANPSTFSHGLGTTPSIVLAVDTSGAGSINTYQCYNYTSTQVTMRSTFVGAGNPFLAIAIA